MSVKRQRTLHPALEFLTLDFKIRDYTPCSEPSFDGLARLTVASGRDITNGLTGTDDVKNHHGQYKRSIDGQWECVDPDERDGRRRINTRGIEVSASSSNDTTDKQTSNNAGRLHDGRTKSLEEDDGEKDDEPESWRTLR
jgi:hypothetical protein